MGGKIAVLLSALIIGGCAMYREMETCVEAKDIQSVYGDGSGKTCYKSITTWSVLKNACKKED